MTRPMLSPREHDLAGPPGPDAPDAKGVSLAAEFVPLPERGRIFRGAARVHLGDVDTDGDVRLGALVRMLQDVATDDAHDAGLRSYDGVWVVRRLDVELTGRAEYMEPLELATFCSGTGPRWAERRTQVSDANGVVAEAVSLWVYLDAAGGRPQRLGERFIREFGESAGGRRVSSRLWHPGPPADAEPRPWRLRDGDFDLLEHLNNARALEAVEDELRARVPGRGIATASIEYRYPVERDEVVALRSVVGREDGHDQLMTWMSVGGDVRVSAVVTLHDERVSWLANELSARRRAGSR